MDVPSNNSDVGWFKLGPQPGDMGSAVIAGHLNGKNNEVGVFGNLFKLKIGDTVIVENSNNKSNIFIVYMTKIYDSGFAPEVFSSVEENNLNLITCDGLWDVTKQSYSKRLVVFAH